jgi:hypothetical protein
MHGACLVLGRKLGLALALGRARRSPAAAAPPPLLRRAAPARRRRQVTQTLHVDADTCMRCNHTHKTGRVLKKQLAEQKQQGDSRYTAAQEQRKGRGKVLADRPE